MATKAEEALVAEELPDGAATAVVELVAKVEAAIVEADAAARAATEAAD